MSESTSNFPCSNCGADLKFEPGQNVLKCPYCAAENTIEADENIEITENDYLSKIRELQEKDNESDKIEVLVIKCDNCGAQVTLGENTTAGECVFCGSHLGGQSHSVKEIKPESMLPFKVNKKEAADNFRDWMKKRWCAPNKLKNFARLDGLTGIYSPYWTYDSNTTTQYRGQRGEYYYTTESYTEEVDGKRVTKTRQVRHTRWFPASGTVKNTFDDVLITASGNLLPKYTEALEPWDLENLVPFDEKYLSGFQVESYTVDLEEGFSRAKSRMQPIIDSSIRRDIGGDEQRISSRNCSYEDISFKHLLLPVWISAYKFKDKVYNFMVNARTGEVQGNRPYSVAKILLAVLCTAAVIAGGVFLYLYFKGNS
jgi:DNA-directed RNA polymerase subunit RPC12/RpoP